MKPHHIYCRCRLLGKLPRLKSWYHSSPLKHSLRLILFDGIVGSGSCKLRPQNKGILHPPNSLPIESPTTYLTCVPNEPKIPSKFTRTNNKKQNLHVDGKAYTSVSAEKNLARERSLERDSLGQLIIISIITLKLAFYY